MRHKVVPLLATAACLALTTISYLIYTVVHDSDVKSDTATSTKLPSKPQTVHIPSVFTASTKTTLSPPYFLVVVSVILAVFLAASAVVLFFMMKPPPAIHETIDDPVDKVDDDTLTDYPSFPLVIGSIIIIIVSVAVLLAVWGVQRHAKSRDSLAKISWTNMFDDQGRLQYQVDSAIKMIRETDIPKKLLPDLWVRIVGVRPWTMSDSKFTTLINTLNRDFEKRLKSNVTLEQQIQKDLPRSAIRNYTPQKVNRLESLWKAYIAKHPKLTYSQGYNILSRVCMEAFEPVDIFKFNTNTRDFSGVSLKVFEVMMQRYWIDLYGVSFEMLPELGQHIMTTIREHDHELYDSLKTNIGIIDDSFMGTILVKPLLLWGQNWSLDDGDHWLLTLWIKVLTFPEPNKAIATFIASVILLYSDSIASQTSSDFFVYLKPDQSKLEQALREFVHL